MGTHMVCDSESAQMSVLYTIRVTGGSLGSCISNQGSLRKRQLYSKWFPTFSGRKNKNKTDKHYLGTAVETKSNVMPQALHFV